MNINRNSKSSATAIETSKAVGTSLLLDVFNERLNTCGQLCGVP